jgi:hypothetical protein
MPCTKTAADDADHCATFTSGLGWLVELAVRRIDSPPGVHPSNNGQWRRSGNLVNSPTDAIWPWIIKPRQSVVSSQGQRSKVSILELLATDSDLAAIDRAILEIVATPPEHKPS